MIEWSAQITFGDQRGHRNEEAVVRHTWITTACNLEVLMIYRTLGEHSLIPPFPLIPNPRSLLPSELTSPSSTISRVTHIIPLSRVSLTFVFPLTELSLQVSPSEN